MIKTSSVRLLLRLGLCWIRIVEGHKAPGLFRKLQRVLHAGLGAELGQLPERPSLAAGTSSCWSQSMEVSSPSLGGLMFEMSWEYEQVAHDGGRNPVALIALSPLSHGRRTCPGWTCRGTTQFGGCCSHALVFCWKSSISAFSCSIFILSASTFSLVVLFSHQATGSEPSTRSPAWLLVLPRRGCQGSGSDSVTAPTWPSWDLSSAHPCPHGRGVSRRRRR